MTIKSSIRPPLRDPLFGPLSRSGGSVVPFSPLDMFSGGRSGAIFDAATLSALTPGVSTVSLADNPVGSDFTQGSISLRPVYNSDGTYHWIAGDGVNDYIQTTQDVDCNVPEFWMWAAIGTVPDTSIALCLAGNDFQYLRIDQTEGFVRAETGSANSATFSVGAAITGSTRILIRVRESDRSVRTWRNGVAQTAATILGTSWWPTLNRMILCGGIGGGGATETPIYHAGFIDGALTTTQQTQLDAFLAEKMP